MNKLKQILIILLFGVGIGLSQNIPSPYSARFTVPDSTAYSNWVEIIPDLYPAAIYPEDSIKVKTLLGFEVKFGTSTKVLGLAGKSDSTLYTIPVGRADTTLILLATDNFWPLAGAWDPVEQVFIRLVLTTLQDGEQNFIVRMRAL